MICYLVRHGKDDDTVRGGWSQQPLTDEGKVQAAELIALKYQNGKWTEQDIEITTKSIETES